MAVVPLALVSRPLAALAGWIAHLGAAGLVRRADLVRFAPALTYRVAPPSLDCRRASTTRRRGRVVALVARPRRARRALRRGRRCRGCGSSSSRGRSSPRAATAGCTSRFSTSARATRRSCVFPRGSTLLVDAGGLSASSVLRHRRPRRRAGAPGRRASARIDYVALTHGDPDHIGGAAVDPARVPAAGGLGRHSGAAVRAADAPAPGGAGAAARGGRTSIAAITLIDRRRRRRRAPSGAGRLGAAEGAQRRLDGARAALARRVGLLTGDIGKAVERAIAPRSRPRACASSRSRTTAA